MKYRILILLALLWSSATLKSQAYLDDIMFQSFGWDEQTQSKITSEGSFYEYYNARAGNLKAMGVDMIWLPPPSASTGGVGYFPTELFNFSNTSWGTEAQLKKMLATMNAKGIYPIADVVVNHRSGTTGWVDFTNPTWGCETICSNDDAAYATYVGCRPSGAPDTGMEFGGSRDLDHTNATVQNGVKEFLGKLKTLGFKGWRWDVAKGFSPSYFGNYIADSQPYYSVGEFWDADVNALKTWINGTYTGGATVSGAFDFSLYYALSNILVTSTTQTASNNFNGLNWSGSMAGLSGQYGFSEKSVTFVDNHDTFVHGSAFTGSNIMRAYAYILTHPGIPCVFAPHYYGGTYTKDGVTRTYSNNSANINKLMAIRKATEVNAYSSITIDKSEAGLYAAYIKKNFADAEPAIAMSIDLNGSGWAPSGSGWILSASGSGYSVWTKAAVNVAPVINITPASGTYVAGNSLSVSITASDDSGVAPTIRYTIDGTEPTASSPVYTSALTVTANTTVKAVAFDNQGLSSGTAERTYSFATPRNIVIRFKPPTNNPNWPVPKIHYWNYTPTNAMPAANWSTPIDMVADTANPGWFMYTFSNIIQVSFLFRDGGSTGTLGSTKTADIVNITQDNWYEWDATSSTYVKQVNLSTGEVNSSSKVAVLELMQNPVTDGLARIQYRNAQNATLFIYDMSGKILLSQKVRGQNGEDSISVAPLSKGVYMMMLKSDQGISVSKLIVK